MTAHGPDEVIGRLLVVRGLGTDPAWWGTNTVADRADAAHDWPVFVGQEPEAPDEVLTVYETTPQVDAKTMPDGQLVVHWGLTVRVRGRTKPAAQVKAAEIARDLNEGVYDTHLTLDGVRYAVQSVRASVVDLKKQQVGSSQRWLRNVNCLAVILAYPTGG